MTRIGITGHRGLDRTTSGLIVAALRSALADHAQDRDDERERDQDQGQDRDHDRRPDGLIGITCLADGADALFAQLVLDVGGAIEAIIPAADYRDRLPADYRPVYDGLLSRARQVHRLDHLRSDPEAYMAASRMMLSTVDALIAVWDGKPARDYGGTADIVAEAIAFDIPVRVLWPEGAMRA